MAVSMIIGYPKDSKFNLDYYLQSHVPAVINAWKPYGMNNWRTTVAKDENSPYVVMSQCDWPNMDAFQNMRSQTTEEVNQYFLDDMKKFVDQDPVIWFMDIKIDGS
ncbi:hypothetical protein F4810DRAFT_185345 [Camillea tinctor]|nr:hypothetical protein F4810DRAFT_185345 [Camillea tinctor]